MNGVRKHGGRGIINGWDSVEVGNLSTGLDSMKVEVFLSEWMDGAARKRGIY